MKRILLAVGLGFGILGTLHAEEPFSPVSVWYGGGTARAPMLERVTPASRAQWRNQLPFFKNQQGFIRHALARWQISGTTFFTAGNPFTVFAGYDVNADGVGGDRPDILDPSILGRVVDNPRLDPGTGQQLSQSRLPSSVFLPNSSTPTAARIFRPGLGNQGSLGRNTFRTDGQNNWDMAVTKTFDLTERYRVLFRWEMYNALNSPQFLLPNQTAISTLLGRISRQRNNRVDTQTGARYMQFVLRIVF